MASLHYPIRWLADLARLVVLLAITAFPWLPVGAAGLNDTSVSAYGAATSYDVTLAPTTGLSEANDQDAAPDAVTQATGIDFVVTAISLTPAAPTASGTFTANVTVKNQGVVAGDGLFLDVWSHQLNSQACGAAGNQRQSVGTLAAGASKTLTFTGLSAGTAGMKAFRAFVDSGCGTAEDTESNNQGTASYVVNLTTQATLTAIATPSTIAYNGTSTLSTTGGSGTGAVTYAVTAGGSVCSVTGSTLTGIGVGSCTVTATKAGGSTYSPATATVSVMVNITKPKVAAGGSHSLALQSNGALMAYGDDIAGELGWGRTIESCLPLQTVDITDVRQLASGRNFTVALKTDGTVWAWGRNLEGQLGDGTTTNSSIPVQVKNLSNVSAISAGNWHTVALKADGTVWAWGYNWVGQLGNGTTTDSSVPVQVHNLTNMAAISAGGNHTVALKDDGTVWVWGDNYYGELGNGTTVNSSVPILVQNLTNVAAISGGGGHTVALKADGTVWTWGSNGYGGLGDGTWADSSVPVLAQNLANAVAISAGGYHTVALKTNGTVWAWGANWNGQLGDGTTTSSGVPVPVQNLTNVATISAGGAHTLAIRADGTVWAWGLNSSGQLGDGTFADHYTPALAENATLDGILDLDLDPTNNDILPGAMPPFFLETIQTGDIPALNLSVNVNLASIVLMNSYVAANAPSGTKTPVCKPQTIQASGAWWTRVFSNPVWSLAGWPIAAFQTNVSVTYQVPILTGCNLTGQAGTVFCVGYGTSADEMKNAGRVRAIYRVPGSSVVAPCLP